ncbi:MAG: tRNA lysidine(34) synthetase TilS [Alphaproteobacteria bacterium]
MATLSAEKMTGADRGFVSPLPPIDPATVFDRYCGLRGLLLAVSGGPDSTALMVLARQWQRARQLRGNVCPALHVAVIDHGLRPESVSEARQAADNANALGLPVQVLCVDLGIERCGAGNVQARARDGRYRCLVAAARNAGCEAIATGHHRDDQAETVLLRLMRGSGLFGLAGMAAEVALADLQLVRPLLNVSRDDLRTIAHGSGLPIADDPSNQDAAYDRVWVRQLLAARTSDLPSRQTLVGLAGRARVAADDIDAKADTLLADFEVDAAGQIRGDRRAFSTVQTVIARRALWRLVRAAGGRGFGPAGAMVADLAGQLARGDGLPFKRTLAGVIVKADASSIRFYREWGRAGLERIAFPPQDTLIGGTFVWDGRFRICAPGQLRGRPVVAGPLKDATGRVAMPGLAADVVATMPGLFDDGRLVAAPNSVVFSPAKGADILAAPAVLELTCLVEVALMEPRAILMPDFLPDRSAGARVFDHKNAASAGICDKMP